MEDEYLKLSRALAVMTQAMRIQQMHIDQLQKSIIELSKDVGSLATSLDFVCGEVDLAVDKPVRKGSHLTLVKG
jgi:hypothetical protein